MTKSTQEVDPRAEKKALEKAIKGLAIEDVYIHSSLMRVDEDYLPKTDIDKPYTVQTRFSVKKSKRLHMDGNDKNNSVIDLFLVHISTGVRFIDAIDVDEIKDESEKLGKLVKAEITAEFVAEYVIKNIDLTQSELDVFAKRNAGYHVWPYWREYVQAQCARLRIPNVMIPAKTF